MNKKVLIIEDHPETSELISGLLKLEGIEPITATNGQEGLEKAHLEKPDLILLDVMMPGMSGFDVCKKLKSDHETSSIPVIIVSIKASEDSLKQGETAGANAYITKPFNPPELLDLVKKYLGLK